MIEGIRNKHIEVKALLSEAGIALPTALLLVMFIVSIGALFANIAQENLKQVKIYEAIHDVFDVSEGGANELMRQISTAPELWKELSPLVDYPAGYEEYSPLSYNDNNGIPPCSGTACHRDLFPTGGGLLKNFGPLNGDGDNVDSEYSITEQLDPNYPPQADIVINNKSAWAQVERLDEISAGENSLGGDVENNAGSGTSSSSVRFRITATSFRKVKGRRGRSTLVYVVELPAS